MDIKKDEAFELAFSKTNFYKGMVESLKNKDCPFESVFEIRNGKYRSSYVQLSHEIWQAAQAVPEGFVLVPIKNTKYFSHDGENYEVHDTLAEAKHEAECAIESFRERLADQLCNPAEDGNFSQVGYGIVLAESGYSVDHIVTQEDVDNGEYGYDVGTEIMSLFLIEAQEPTND